MFLICLGLTMDLANGGSMRQKRQTNANTRVNNNGNAWLSAIPDLLEEVNDDIETSIQYRCIKNCGKAGYVDIRTCITQRCRNIHSDAAKFYTNGK